MTYAELLQYLVNERDQTQAALGRACRVSEFYTSLIDSGEKLDARDRANSVYAQDRRMRLAGELADIERGIACVEERMLREKYAAKGVIVNAP